MHVNKAQPILHLYSALAWSSHLVISWAATDIQSTQHRPIPAARFLLTKRNEDRQVCACVANQCCQAETSNLKKNRPIFNNSWLPSWPGYDSSAMSSCLIGFWWDSSIIKTHLRGQYSNISVRREPRPLAQYVDNVLRWQLNKLMNEYIIVEIELDKLLIVAWWPIPLASDMMHYCMYF